jgi:hypothetical protein
VNDGVSGDNRAAFEGYQRSTAIVTFRAGRIILVEYFLDHDEALKAVGLEE